MKNPFRRVASAMESASADLQQMRGNIEALKVELAAVKHALLPREEVIAVIDRQFDLAASRCGFDPLAVTSRLYVGGDIQGLIEGITHLFVRSVARAEWIARVDAHLENHPPGLPAEGHAEKIAELEAQLLEAEREEETFIEQARAAGMRIARRPDADPRAVLAVEP
jgi:hypothetical protein